jgi:hypothetical protein
MANKIEKKAVRFQATGNMAEEAAKIGKSMPNVRITVFQKVRIVIGLNAFL